MACVEVANDNCTMLACAFEKVYWQILVESNVDCNNGIAASGVCTRVPMAFRCLNCGGSGQKSLGIDECTRVATPPILSVSRSCLYEWKFLNRRESVGGFRVSDMPRMWMFSDSSRCLLFQF